MQIRAYRKEKKMTQRQLAKLLGITQPYLSELESGRKRAPSLPLVVRLSDTLQVPLEQLLKEKAR